MQASLSALAITCLALSASLSCASSERNIQIDNNYDIAAERRSEAQRAARNGNSSQVVLIVYGHESELRLTFPPRVRDKMLELFTVREIRVSHPYDQSESVDYWTRAVRSGRFYPDTTFDYYLMHRGNPFSRDDIFVLRRLGVTKTPAVFVFNRRSEVIDSWQYIRQVEESEVLSWLIP